MKYFRKIIKVIYLGHEYAAILPVMIIISQKNSRNICFLMVYSDNNGNFFVFNSYLNTELL